MPSLSPALLIVGNLLLTLGVLMLLPVTVSHGDPLCGTAFLRSAAVTLGVGAVLFWRFKREFEHVRAPEVFLITALSWLIVPSFAALPLLIGPCNMDLTDALFESISGITTTGSTVLTGLDELSRPILLWRSLLQWIGGIGIIAMAVAVLPFLRVGGMRLFQTESSDWSEKAVPRARKLAKALLVAYLVLSALCALSYWLAGMTPFEAINHAMTTISTGGYSTSDASMGHFDSPVIQWTGILFMGLGALPFVLYVRFWSTFNSSLFRDTQVRGFLAIFAIVALLLAADLVYERHDHWFEAMTQAGFNVMSIMTTTGYASSDYTTWSPLAVAAFFALTFVGGCSGSTAGGMKVFRFQLSLQLAHEQVRQLIHPNRVAGRRYNDRHVDEAIIASAVTFAFLFFATLVIMTLALAMLGLDLVTALSGSATALANVGPGLGAQIGPAGNFAALPDAAKWILCAGMLLGRLELISVVVLFSPEFWRG